MLQIITWPINTAESKMKRKAHNESINVIMCRFRHNSYFSFRSHRASNCIWHFFSFGIVLALFRKQCSNFRFLHRPYFFSKRWYSNRISALLFDSDGATISRAIRYMYWEIISIYFSIRHKFNVNILDVDQKWAVSYIGGCHVVLLV